MTAADKTTTLTALFLTAVSVMLVQAWLLMLALGALHHEVSTDVPALSYWASVLVVWIIDFVRYVFRRK